jgi:uncharacterized protein (DUF305 family)
MTQTAARTDATAPERSGRTLRVVLLGIIGVAVVAIAAVCGYFVGNGSGDKVSTPSSTSVDAGFAWDMTVHHRQAVTMAGFVRDHTKDPRIYTLAFDIETSQFNQVGQMQGWLDAWGLPTNNPNMMMAWMTGHDSHMDMSGGLMPGMATPAEMTELESLSGKALDVKFLQLMLRHHQGGLPMAEQAAARASKDYVRNSAQHMVDGQQAEVVLMESMLRERGASPLPPPA